MNVIYYIGIVADCQFAPNIISIEPFSDEFCYILMSHEMGFSEFSIIVIFMNPLALEYSSTFMAIFIQTCYKLN